MKRTYYILWFSFLVVLFFLPPGFSQEPGQEEHGETTAREAHDEKHTEEAEQDEHGEAEGHGGRSHHLNDFAVFLGGTDEHGHPTEFTWGLDYKRRIADHWAIGGLFDYAGGLRNAIVAASVTWLPVGNLTLTAAPGIEFHQGRDPRTLKSEETPTADKDATYFVFRLGVGWGITIGESYAIEPQINLDLVNGEKVWVYGLNFIYAW